MELKKIHKWGCEMNKNGMRDPKKKKGGFAVYMKRYWQLYVLLLLPLLYLLIFKYIPMIYMQIAFKKYSIVQSVWEMPLAANHGFEYFIKAFQNRDFINALRNTLVLNLLDLIFGFPAPIIFALSWCSGALSAWCRPSPICRISSPGSSYTAWRCSCSRPPRVL